MICSRCKKEKHVDQFYKNQKWCKSCSKEYAKQNREKHLDKYYETRRKYHQENKTKRNAQITKWKHSNKDRLKNAELLRLYGLSLDDYNKILEQQEQKCFICRKPAKTFKRSLAVDHCHRTLEVRGLLCPWCNRGLRYYQDDPDRMRRAADHLERHTGFFAPKNRKRKRKKRK